MTVRTAATLKTQFAGTDPADQNADLIDSVLSTTNLPVASNAQAVAGTATSVVVTPANVRAVMQKIKMISFDGKSGTGSITATGAVAADLVLYVFGLTGGALGSASASYETTITVNDQIQQSSASNLSANDYVALLLSVA